jgi:hypothetical protein
MFYPDNSERTIIKADPDWFVGWPYREDGKRGVALEPIVAWLIVHGANDYHLSAKASRSEKSVHDHGERRPRLQQRGILPQKPRWQLLQLQSNLGNRG